MKYRQFLKTYPKRKEEAEERAAIMQYEGEMSKEEAEMSTVYRLRAKYRLFEEGENENKSKY